MKKKKKRNYDIDSESLNKMNVLMKSISGRGGQPPLKSTDRGRCTEFQNRAAAVLSTTTAGGQSPLLLDRGRRVSLV